ncbi:MAG: alcohol dehydrogenase catalytic domain-containing protein [Myxococcales bacterium]|nr:alcohol dehydrogenase catalytic domain-containing protein [Myxococcales bacterium]
MATAWRRGAGPYVLEEVALSDTAPGPGRVALEVEAVAIDPFEATPVGRVPGVAAVGRVVAVGVAADEWLGARVLVPTVVACGECERCRRGGAAVCADGGRLGVTAPGALATHLTAAARWLVRLDEPLALPGPGVAALGGALAHAYTLYARASLGPRDPAIVIGGGPLCRLVVEVLLAQAATPVVATDDAATIAAVGGRARVCAIHTAAIEDALAGVGARPRRVIVTDGAHVEAALRVAGRRGTVVVAAGAQAAMAAPLEVAMAEEVTIAGVVDGHPDLVPELAAVCARGELALADLTEIVSLAELPARLAARARARPATALVVDLRR